VISVPEPFIVQTFYQNVAFTSHNKYSGTFNGSCPFCKEGKSYGKKTRFFYIPKKNICYCHNCGYSKRPLNFILDVTGKSLIEIINEVKELDNITITGEKEENPTQIRVTKSLPDDCVNLTDQSQLLFHKNNPIVQQCISFIKSRRLDTAVNRPNTYYVSLNDPVHKNRLVLPFYDQEGDIIFYQTRTILQKDTYKKPKYLSKIGSEKSLYGIHKLEIFHDNVYIFEGPIDSYFVENGLAVCGIQDDSYRAFNDLQQIQINQLMSFNKIWCLDNQWNDNASLKKSLILLDNNENVFIWPENFKKFKDFNDICVATKKDKISPEFITKNTYSGLKAKILLTNIRNKR